MAHIIIGHTTETTARILVRGDNRRRRCEVVVHCDGLYLRRQAECFEHNDYVTVVAFENLLPGCDYAVTATFDPGSREVTGRFRTLPRLAGDRPLDVSFVLSSCNLSVISINNFLAFLLATAGASTAMTSLDSPLDRWRRPAFLWLRRLWRGALKVGLYIVSDLVRRETGIKQPGPPFIRSPFLKVAAVFDSWIVEVGFEPGVRLPAVGDAVRAGHARGVVACLPSTRPDPDAKPHKGNAQPKSFRLVLTHVEGVFEKETPLCRVIDGKETEVGQIRMVQRAEPWFEQPSFFVHAGDQIYYDFPKANRAPDRNEYRLAYREAWFEDEANRYLLAHWPNYMTLDDHEIADQFANDFVPPLDGTPAAAYLRAARAAYLEYVDTLNPSRPQRETGALWYTFDKGPVHFFVMDTRTQRYTRGPIIDTEQMNALCGWMLKHEHGLKFIVTSVPFVAEINEDASEDTVRWKAEGASAPSPAPVQPSTNRLNDKWSAPHFAAQREQIIDFIDRHRIEYIVFLTGDMHCCYHATMRIGGKSVYDAITVHELAGGPANQLQLASVEEFIQACTRHTKKKVRFDIALDRFHSQASGVLHLKVAYEPGDDVVQDHGASTRGQPTVRPLVPRVDWNVIRTLTSNDANNWWPGAEPVMQGRILFSRARSAGDLQPW